MKIYGKVKANSLWTTVNGKVECVFHNSSCSIEEEKDGRLLCYFPYLNDKFWVLTENIEIIQYY